ncbi:phosphate propanoyltransferase [Caldanaerobius polysaccharolyticus]|uniref:phosphate propanoyltransferase n=1 Tax=Caldanaerobius polysaccharolyticus TaxID=44256 RepID=UPI00047EA712|nr:phosphate propanoyltransferase [Caldanaerobius polysaccharolyticus]
MEEWLVELVTKAVKETLAQRTGLKIPVAVSARHVHLSKQHFEMLFGEGYELKKKKELMGGQFAAEECVTVVGKKLSAIENVRIVGPLRKFTQVEVSRTDAVKLGLDPPVRESGKIEGSAPITIVGPKGAVSLNEGCIIASRHIHMSLEDAERFGVSDNQKVSVKVFGERGGILHNVQVRVDKAFTLEMHIDTDEANALGITSGSLVEILK